MLEITEDERSKMAALARESGKKDRGRTAMNTRAALRRLLEAMAERSTIVMHTTLTCVYCGKEYPAGTPAAGAEVQVLTDHIRTCEKHPMRAVEAERDEWKRRAEAHGCDTERGDIDCG